MGQEVLFEQAHSSIINLKNVYFYYLDIVSYKNIKNEEKNHLHTKHCQSLRKSTCDQSGSK